MALIKVKETELCNYSFLVVINGEYYTREAVGSAETEKED